MKRRAGFVTKATIGALLSSAAWAMPGMQAQAADMPVKAMESTDPVPYWWFHGTVEAGGRFFLNSPQNAKQTANLYPGSLGGFGQAGQSLAGFYQYSDNRPGPFGNVDLAVGSKDGLYLFKLLGTNIGYNDQSYNFDASKAGQYYLSLGWDQSPHLYSTSALTPYVVNGNKLTVNGAANSNSTQTLAPYAQPTDIGIKRDTASVQYRWTPTDDWDIKADLSHLSRTGTQPFAVRSGIVVSPSQLPKPVDDTTQNYSLSGEHVGTSPWGQNLVLKGGYKGSQYTDNYASFTVANGAGLTQAEVSTPPSNQMNSGNATVAADLPWWKSRYVGTLSYGQTSQDAAFIGSNISQTVVGTLPATSLNGRINTTLFNNVVTSKITPELTNKLSYRYYDFNNATQSVSFMERNPLVFGFGLGNTQTISPGYLKQNAGDELVWRPTKEWNLGVAYGYERYDYTRADVNATNENSAKIFADWKPNSWLTARSSALYGNRRYETYNYLNYVGLFQWPSAGPQNPWSASSYQYADSYRQMMYDNRETWKVKLAVDIVVLPMLTITPTLQYLSMDYGVDPALQQGLKNSTKWTAGIDATYVVNPNTSVMVGYMYDHSTQLLYGCIGEGAVTPTATPCTPYTAAAPSTLTNDNSRVHTFITAIKYAAIPNKLDTELRYTASYGLDAMRLYVGGLDPTQANGGQFPENTTWFQRLDATGTYKFDPETVAQLGWKGDVKAKLRYTWERNSATNWANDGLLPYTPTTAFAPNTSSNALWLGWNNPNYNVHMLTASLVASW